MTDLLEYKGYHTRIVYDSESQTLRGKIEGINDFVDFESDSIQSVELEFHAAVDEYLAFCEQVNKIPDKEYKGSFNVRISPELHKKIAQKAFRDKVSLNTEVEKAIEAFVFKESVQSRSVSSYQREYLENIQTVFRDYLSGSATGSYENNIIPFSKKAAQ